MSTTEACAAGLETENRVDSKPSAALVPARLSIRLKLPLLICSLLMGVVLAYSWSVYSEVKRSALGAASDRLRGVTRQLADLTGTSTRQRIAEISEAAKRPSIIAYLRSGSTAAEPGARDALSGLVHQQARQNELVRVELWDGRGASRLGSGADFPALDPTAAQDLIRSIRPDKSPVIGPLQASGKVLQYSMIAPVSEGEATLGYVVHRRRLAGTSRAAQQLGALIGSDQAALFMGNARGDLWTDLVGVVPPPPVSVTTATDRLLEYDRPQSGGRIAAAAAVAGTPWVLLVEFPRGPVLARARLVSTQLGLIGLALLAAGGAGAWVLSRNLTRPLADLGAAAGAIAAGDYRRRIQVDRNDELGQLGAAFNTMAHGVEESQVLLKEKVWQLGAAADLYRRLFESNPHPMWVYGSDSLEFVAVNEAAINHYGYSKDEFLRMTIKDIGPAEDVPALVERAAEDGPGVDHTGVWRHRKKDGTMIDVEITSHHLDVDGRRARLVLAHDVTERLRAEEGIRRLNAELEKRVVERTAELEAANRELEAFSYSVSHDLRAPLRAIDGFSQAMIEDYGQVIDETGRGYLQRLRAASQRMADLIDDFLNLSRVTRTEMRRESVDLSALASGIVEELRKSNPARRVEFAITPMLVADGDRRLLRVVLENLLRNAWKFTGKRERARIEFGVAERTGRRAYFVRDDGTGFDMAYATKLFVPFQRLHGVHEFDGTGIGLATVHRIMQRHGGRVWAEGEVDRGATIWFTL